MKDSIKPRFSDLTPEQQATFGNGCGTRLIKVPDWVFTPSCRVHDFIWSRGSGYDGSWAEKIHVTKKPFVWVVNIIEYIIKAIYYYTRGNWHFFVLMLGDCNKPWLYPVAVWYFTWTMLLSWPAFTPGRWRTIEEILEYDAKKKAKRVV